MGTMIFKKYSSTSVDSTKNKDGSSAYSANSTKNSENTNLEVESITLIFDLVQSQN